MPHTVSRPRPSGRIPGACDCTGAGSGLGVTGCAPGAESVMSISATTAGASRGRNLRWFVIGRARFSIARESLRNPSLLLPHTWPDRRERGSHKEESRAPYLEYFLQ